MLINLLADLQDLAADTEWMTWALCAETDSDAFFPERGGSARHAKAICSGCPAQEECLEYALEYGEVGIWGGTTETQRRRMKRADLAA